MPSDEDVRSAEHAVHAHAGGRANGTRALLLGVTPDLANMRWPDRTVLLSVDSSLPFVQRVWPGDIPGRRYAVHGDWRHLPVRDASCDVAVGDGSLNCVSYPDGVRYAARAIRQALAPDGTLILRLYVRPDTCESGDDVMQEAAAGRIETFHQFKFRLLMALQRSTQDGIAVRDVHQYWHEHKQRVDPLRAVPGWTPAVLDTIETYRDSATVHTFPALGEWRAVLHEQFDEVGMQTPSYVLGERCPLMVLRPRPWSG